MGPRSFAKSAKKIVFRASREKPIRFSRFFARTGPASLRLADCFVCEYTGRPRGLWPRSEPSTSRFALGHGRAPPSVVGGSTREMRSLARERVGTPRLLVRERARSPQPRTCVNIRGGYFFLRFAQKCTFCAKSAFYLAAAIASRTRNLPCSLPSVRARAASRLPRYAARVAADRPLPARAKKGAYASAVRAPAGQNFKI